MLHKHICTRGTNASRTAGDKRSLIMQSASCHVYRLSIQDLAKSIVIPAKAGIYNENQTRYDDFSIYWLLYS